MPVFRRIHLTILVLVFASLVLATNAKAEPVFITLTPTAYDAATGAFTLIGSFTNTGNTSFTANHFDISFSPDIGPFGVSANTTAPDCCPYAQPIPGMSTTAVLPLLDVSLFSFPGVGTYTGTLTFSGFDSNGVAITTEPAQFTVNVPVPEPATMMLLGTGLIGAAASARRRRKAMRN